LIGLSLSFCVRDIANGVFDISDVKQIITDTKCSTPDDWEYLISRYKKVYWEGIEDLAVGILVILIRDNKIYQPRLNDEPRPHISKGIWVEDETSLAGGRQCSDCSIMENLMCPMEIMVLNYPESYRQPLVPTFYPETTPFQLGCYYFQKK
jgi:hypothetical protein